MFICGIEKWNDVGNEIKTEISNVQVGADVDYSLLSHSR